MAAKKKNGSADAMPSPSVTARIRGALEKEFGFEVPVHQVTWWNHHAKQLALIVEKEVGMKAAKEEFESGQRSSQAAHEASA
jgi:hypothetical protein